MNTEVEMTLTQAQKYLSTLTTYFSNSPAKKTRRMRGASDESVTRKHTVTVDQVSKLTSDLSKATELFSELRNKSIEEHERRTNVEFDLDRFKNVIYDKNAEVGLSGVLTEISILGKKKAELANVVAAYAGSSLFSADKFESLFSNYKEKSISEYSSSSSVSVKLFSDKELSEALKKNAQDLRLLEERRDYLNSKTKLKFVFTEDTKNVLGI